VDPRLERLANVIVELIVRELESKTPSLQGKHDDGVKDSGHEHSTSDSTDRVL
jgi:hypothetical protein